MKSVNQNCIFYNWVVWGMNECLQLSVWLRVIIAFNYCFGIAHRPIWKHNQRVGEHKHSIIGEHLKQEHRVKPSKSLRTSPFLRNAEATLSAYIRNAIHSKENTRKLNNQADSISRETFSLIRANHALWQTLCISFWHFYFCIYIFMLIFSYFTFDNRDLKQTTTITATRTV